MIASRERVLPDRTPARWWLCLGAWYALVHVAALAAGVRFDRTPLIEYLHYLDPELLRTRLAESVWYLHVQPPFFNLFVGLVLKVTPESGILFHALFLALGFTLYTGAFALQVRLGVRRPVAAVLCGLFVLSPSFLIFEHFLIYMLPCAAALVIAAVALHESLAKDSRRALAAFFVCLAVLCGTWTAFHLFYFIMVWAGLILLWRGRRRRALLFGAVPFLIIAGIYVKNYALFGEFTACTVSGRNLWIMTAGNMRWEDKVRWVEEGKLSEVSLVNRWASLDVYGEEYLRVPPGFAEIPALSEEHKSNGAVNYNHYGQIAVSRHYAEDGRYALLRAPRTYLISVALSVYRYFAPATERPIAPANMAALQPLITIYDYAACGKWPGALPDDGMLRARGGHPPFLFLLAGLPLLFGFGMLLLYRGRRDSSAAGLDGPGRIVLAFLLFHIAMIAGLGCGLDFTDGSRYRFTTDAFYLTLAGLFISWWALRRSTR